MKAITNIERQVVPDDNHDRSWLEDDDRYGGDPDAEKYIADDAARLASYGDVWIMVGVRAVATLDINGIRQTIESPGLWGIESDSGEAYLSEVYSEELDTLGDMLHELGFGGSDILEHAPELCRHESAEA